MPLSDGERDLFRDLERDARDEEEGREPEDCESCLGTGEGMVPDSLCHFCKGTGIDRGDHP